MRNNLPKLTSYTGNVYMTRLGALSGVSKQERLVEMNKLVNRVNEFSHKSILEIRRVVTT